MRVLVAAAADDGGGLGFIDREGGFHSCIAAADAPRRVLRPSGKGQQAICRLDRVGIPPEAALRKGRSRRRGLVRGPAGTGRGGLVDVQFGEFGSTALSTQDFLDLGQWLAAVRGELGGLFNAVHLFVLALLDHHATSPKVAPPRQRRRALALLDHGGLGLQLVLGFGSESDGGCVAAVAAVHDVSAIFTSLLPARRAEVDAAGVALPDDVFVVSIANIALGGVDGDLLEPIVQ